MMARPCRDGRLTDALRAATQPFNSRDQNERGALTIVDGMLYVPFGGHFGGLWRLLWLGGRDFAPGRRQGDKLVHARTGRWHLGAGWYQHCRSFSFHGDRQYL